MSLFTASNGVVLDEHGDEYDVQLRHRKGDTHEARKEFYQNLRDKELGQTREGDMIVRPLSDDEVLVLDESTSRSAVWHRHENPMFNGAFGRDEAKRYFEAHPEPKPWHDATPGEVWVLHDTGFPDSEGLPYVVGADGFRLVGFERLRPIPFTSPKIVKAVRLWPEGAK